MNINGIYYLTDDLKNIIKICGGEWNYSKKRPVVCLIKSSENENLY